MSRNKRRNAVDFAESFIETEIYENAWGSTPEELLSDMLDLADLQGVEIVNLDLFDYEQFFTDANNEMKDLIMYG